MEKPSEFKEWVKKVSEEWKHIPSLKGKQAERNLFILKSLLITQASGISTWDLALQWLQATDKKFNTYEADTIYHKRQVENAKMNRRLNALTKMQYVRKEGSLFQLTGKGFTMTIIWDPSLINSMTISKLNAICSTILLSEEESTFLHNSVCCLLGSQNGTNMDEQAHQSMKQFLSEEVTCKTLSYLWKRILLSWKANVDDMPETDFVVRLIVEAQKQAGKKGIKI
jgi:hypothetical protein